jgi:hypothetical protein
MGNDKRLNEESNVGTSTPDKGVIVEHIVAKLSWYEL